jgi:hypothetical protein
MLIEIPDALVKKYQDAKRAHSELRESDKITHKEYRQGLDQRDYGKRVKARANSELINEKVDKAYRDMDEAFADIRVVVRNAITPK